MEEDLQEPENQYYHDYDEELREWEHYCDWAENQIWGL